MYAKKFLDFKNWSVFLYSKKVFLFSIRFWMINKIVCHRNFSLKIECFVFYLYFCRFFVSLNKSFYKKRYLNQIILTWNGITRYMLLYEHYFNLIQCALLPITEKHISREVSVVLLRSAFRFVLLRSKCIYVFQMSILFSKTVSINIY